MGHKYSTSYTHNTNANLEKVKYKFPVVVEKIHDKLYPYSALSHSHMYPVKCILCYKSLFQKPVLILDCRSKHRYHPECVVKHYERLKNITSSREDVQFLNCRECRDLFNMSNPEWTME